MIEYKIDHSIVFFTGLDRCGKSTTRLKYATSVKQVNMSFDRSFIDNLVFNEFYRNVKFSNKDIKKYIRRFSRLRKVYVVYLKVDFNEINRRAKATENIEYDVKNLNRIQNLFFKYLRVAKMQGINVVVIDANNKTAEEIVNVLIEKVKV